MKFTIFDHSDRAFAVEVESLNSADRKTNHTGFLFIRGRAGDIGVRKYKETNKTRNPVALKMVGVYSVVAGEEEVVIANATYRGRRMLNNDRFLVFVKNGVRFWVYESGAMFFHPNK